MAGSPSADRIQRLVAQCVEELERGAPDPVSVVCADEPQLAEAVRERLERLRGIGLVGADGPLDTLESFGPYRILERLGTGGMGTVWLAEQQRPVQRRVALKLIKRGMDTEGLLARFESEREALARLSHPHVATIFDAGIVPDGRPFFAMELVEGEPITVYADAHQLSIERRIELLLPVCDAVQHAHRRGLIHRDLKPSNILVGERDGTAVPVVIDFGVAKAVDDSAQQRAVHTEVGEIIGTPAYMSPEQAGQGAAGIDTRSDVYSLGVVLYELFTGQLPADCATPLRDAAGPPSPSARVHGLAGAGAAVARSRRATVDLLRRRLHGELDWIALRALAPEPDRRYGSVAELGDDLRRHLRGDPVVAAPPSKVYAVCKAVRRHRVGFALGFALLLGLTMALVGVGLGLREARQQTLLAHRDLADALDTVDQLLVRGSEVHLANVPRATEIEVGFRGDALEALQRLLARRPDSRDLQVRVARRQVEFGQGLFTIGRIGEAREQLEEAATALEQLRRSADAEPDLASSYAKVCCMLHPLHALAGRREEAARWFHRAEMELVALRVAQPQEPLHLRWLAEQRMQFGELVLGPDGAMRDAVANVDGALALARELVERWPEGPENAPTLAKALTTRALFHARAGSFESALPLVEEAIGLGHGAAEAHPERRQGAEIVADGHLLAGKLELAAGEVTRGIVRLRQAIVAFEQLLTEFPHVLESAHKRGQAAYELGSALVGQLAGGAAELDELIDVVEAGARSNGAALAAYPSDVRYLGMQRKLLQLLGLALDAHGDGPRGTEVAQELSALPVDASSDRELARHRRAFAAFRER